MKLGQIAVFDAGGVWLYVANLRHWTSYLSMVTDTGANTDMISWKTAHQSQNVGCAFCYDTH